MYKCNTCRSNERRMFGKDEICEEPNCVFYPNKTIEPKLEEQPTSKEEQYKKIIINEKTDVKTLLNIY